MGERYTLIDGKEMSYQGLFEVAGLYKIIDRFLLEHHWEKHEVKNYETVEPKGRQIVLELMPWKTISDYMRKEMRIFMILSELKDSEVEIDGVKKTVQTGKAYFSFDAYLLTDYASYWEGSPIMYFFRVIVDKFVRKGVTTSASNECVGDCRHLQDEIKSYLNMNRYLAAQSNAPERKGP